MRKPHPEHVLQDIRDSVRQRAHTEQARRKQHQHDAPKGEDAAVNPCGEHFRQDISTPAELGAAGVFNEAAGKVPAHKQGKTDSNHAQQEAVAQRLVHQVKLGHTAHFLRHLAVVLVDIRALGAHIIH